MSDFTPKSPLNDTSSFGNEGQGSLAENSTKAALTEFFRLSQGATTAIGMYLKEMGLTLSVAESCTGGLLGASITQVSGVSSWFNGGCITYSNASKENLLNVSPSVLEQYGAVSALTVCQMAAGVAKSLQADIALSVSGVAGPDGGTEEKPVGTVWIGMYLPGNLQSLKEKHQAGIALVRKELQENGAMEKWTKALSLLNTAYCKKESPSLKHDNHYVLAKEFAFEGDRNAIRQSAALMALYFVCEYIVDA